MDKNTLIAAIDFSRARLLGILDTIEKGGQDIHEVLAWRPGPGRAHIAWQAMHCAATHDKYLNVGLLKGQPKDAELVKNYGGGSTPSDSNVPTIETIRRTLESTLSMFKSYVAEQTIESLERKLMFGTNERTIGESIVLLTWHEAHHQGQIHLTWNLYKAAKGI